MPRPVLLAALLVLSSAASAASTPPAPPWPEINATTKPWSRWWWLGNILDERTTTAVMEQYAAAGLGGLEITPIYGVAGYEHRFLPYLSAEWMQQFRHVLAEGRRLDLGLDMATGTGWPFGGPWIEGDDTCRYLAHKSWTLPGGGRLAEPVEFVARPVVRAVGSQLYEFHGPVYRDPGAPPEGTPAQPAPRRGGPRVRIEDLVEPIAANPNLQALALDQIRFPKRLPLASLMAFGPAGETEDLTARVGADGALDWAAPGGGDWRLIALFSGWHGKMVERAAPGGEGNVIDHFSRRALEAYLKKFDAAFAGTDLTGLRAYYNDSYEVDDAQGESDWTLGFLAEFQKRRGYDLRRHLPALLANDDSEAAQRVRTDYRETISDLLLDEFTKPWRDWAKAQGRMVRNQAHGSPANILDLYAASDIPEQEGNDVVAIKLASSAAHVTGKRLTAAESATWLDEHFSSTLGDIKRSVDTYFLGGVNHNCYHGTAYSPPEEPWPGFHFYASVELNPSNPIWADFPVLNAYVARAQSFLQSGEPDEGILLYYNIHDRWAQRGNGSMPHFHGRPAENVGARAAADKLHAAGHGFDFVSDRMIQDLRADPDGGAILAGRQRYRVIVVPATRTMPLATFRRLVELADAGATVIFEGDLPADVPGAGDLAARRESLRALLSRVRPATTVDGTGVAEMGRGQFLIGNDVLRLLARADVHPEPAAGHGLQFVRRRNERGAFYFLVNRADRSFEGWLQLQSAGRGAAIFDPMTGRAGLAAVREGSGSRESSVVHLQLAPGASCVVQLYEQRPSPEAASWAYRRPAGPAQPLAGEWSVEFLSGGPTLPARLTVPALRSWTEFGSEDLKAYAGTARYTLNFPRPAGDAAAWQLDLGAIADSARVTLNGREIAALIAPPWQVALPASDLREQNELAITVTNLAANRIADLDRRGVPWKKFYNVNMPARRPENRDANGLFSAAKWTPRASGLLGPVTLTPLVAFEP
ncbi:MAG TPA: glycosyl hydrolase [Opitutaceae bacterium]|nr:glycosyl hydrolase [Opitutaceae bacterium]